MLVPRHSGQASAWQAAGALFGISEKANPTTTACHSNPASKREKNLYSVV